MKKEIFIALMVISMFFISACDVYNTLYVRQGEGEAVEVPEGEIMVEGEEESVEEEMEDITGIIEEIEISIEEEVEEEMEEEEIPEDATVIIVEETETISLVTQAEDPDADVLIFTYTSPLDEEGEWQTTYGDAGEYTVTVTASDGELTASKEVLIIVNRKEESPTLDSFSPEDTAIEIDETDTVTFDVLASDLNNDILSYIWKLDGIDTVDRSSYEYQTTYEDSGSHTVKIIVSDGIFDTEKIWSVTVNNLNREPVLEEIDDVEVRETDIVVIELEAYDDDGDELSYEIVDERFVQDENIFTWETTYDDAGEHLVTVTISDGVDSTTQEITVTIENVNRPPVILDIVQK